MRTATSASGDRCGSHRPTRVRPRSVMRNPVRLSARLAKRVERAWLQALPHLARDYAWIERDGVYLFGTKAHQRILYRVARGSFEPFTTQLFTAALKPGMVVLDIGAYVGHYALLAARLVGPEGQVFAFECHPVSFRFLQHNIAINKRHAPIVAVQRAVAHRSGVMPFFLRGGDTTMSSLWQSDRAKETVEVECTTIDAMFADEQIDVIKLDIEGGEIQALKGMERTLARAKRLVLFVECNPHALSAADGSVAGLLGCLEGFDVRVIHEKEKTLSADFDELFAAERSGPSNKYFVNLYCTKGIAATV
jgi:FkbM family methyltransferase